MAEVAVLGTGRMGAAMATKVAEAGHQVTVWNRTRSTADALAGPVGAGRIEVADSATSAVAGRDVVLSVLADGTATCAVLLDGDVVAALHPGAVVCDLATSGLAAAHLLARVLGAAGFGFVDAPVSGSVMSVRSGTLLVMAAGPPEAIDAAGPVLDAFARRVVRVGAAGAGQLMKLAVNLVVHDLNSALSEALSLAESGGIARESAYDVFADSVVAAPFVTYKREAFLDPSAPVAMSLDLVRKDLGLILAQAQEFGLRTDVTAASEALVAGACDAGMGELDMAALSRFPGIRTSS